MASLSSFLRPLQIPLAFHHDEVAPPSLTTASEYALHRAGFALPSLITASEFALHRAAVAVRSFFYFASYTKPFENDEAEKLALEVLCIREKAFGDYSLPVGDALDCSVSIQARLGKDDSELLELFRRILIIQEKGFIYES